MEEVLQDLEKKKYVRTQMSNENSGLKIDQVNEMNKGRLIET